MILFIIYSLHILYKCIQFFQINKKNENKNIVKGLKVILFFILFYFFLFFVKTGIAAEMPGIALGEANNAELNRFNLSTYKNRRFKCPKV